MQSKLLMFSAVAAVLGLLVFPVAAQTVHFVSAGDNTLFDAVGLAADGDILELVDDGGLYTYSLSDKIEISKKLTIRANEGLTSKPIIRTITTGTTSGRHFDVLAGGTLTLIGLDLDGSADESGVPYIKNGVRLNTGDSSSTKLIVDDCVLRNYTEQFIKGYYKTIVDTLIVTNTVFINAEREGLMMYESSGNGPGVTYALIENCTFSKVGREAIKFEDNDPDILINHCTFDSISIGSGQNKRIINLTGHTKAVVKNIIMSNQLGTYSASLSLYGNSTISYSDTFNVRPVATNDAATIGMGMIDADPMYTDAANNDFTLMTGSPALEKADDGYAMGDLRWDPSAQGPKIHRVSAGDNTLFEAVQAAGEDDILELVDDGGLYTYSLSDKIEVDKPLTIRAKEGLNTKPIIRTITTGTTSGRHFDVLAGGTLTLIGLDLDGSADESGVPYIKNGVRLNTGDSSSTKLIVDDCVLRNYTEQFIKGYYKTIVDTLIVTNTVFINAEREGLMMYESSGNGPGVTYALIENCTFSKVGREAIKFEDNDPDILINHCTFDSISIGSGQNKRIINLTGHTKAVVKNIIMSNQLGTYSASLSLYGNSTISYSDTFNVRPVATNDAATIGMGMIDADPMYKDAANNDFRLATSSPARGAADDAKAMGDLRWEADPAQFMLTVNIEGNGSVSRSDPGPYYDPASTVTLTAQPNPGWALVGWEGVTVFPPNNPVVNVTMDADKIVKAIFESISTKYELNLAVVPGDYGHVTANPLPVKDNLYVEGTSVTLTAVADSADWIFEMWSGDVMSTDNPLVIKVDSTMNITAFFKSTLPQDTLTITVVGMGSVTADPAPLRGSYDRGTVVALTANPDLGWEFVNWSGDVGSPDNPLNVMVSTNITLTANFAEIMAGGVLAIDTTWDLRDAVQYANNNSYVDTLILITSGGVYTTRSTSDLAVWEPLTILAAEGLDEMPIVTNSDPEKASDDIFRVFNDFTIRGVILDGGHAMTHGPKYGIRLRNYSAEDSVKWGSNIIVSDCEFRDFFENKDPKADGHPFKIDVDIKAGTVKFERCTFIRTGYEAIRISDTEKWNTDRQLDSLIVRNCSFTDIDAEGIRYYSDLDPATPDAPVIIEHVTFDNTATRVMYLKNSGGAIVRDLLITNSRTSGHGRDSDLMDAQGTTGVPSYVSHVDTFNVPHVPILAADGTIDSTTIFGFDPRYQDAANMDWTLLPGSPAYGAAHDGLALGDLRWSDPVFSAIENPEIVPLVYTLEQNYPNPFNPSTTIKFSLQKSGLTTLKIYDLLGRRVATLVDEKMESGVHEVRFENPNLATGVYFYHLQSGEFQSVKKMLLIK